MPSCQRSWLLVRKDTGGPAEYMFTIADLKEAIDIIAAEPGSTEEIASRIASGQQLNSLTLVDLYHVIANVMAYAAERRAAAAGKEMSVQTYVAADRKMNGIVLEGLRLSLVMNGRGHRLAMTPEQARELGERLIAAAAEHEAPSPESLN